jgi:hypothetical protein
VLPHVELLAEEDLRRVLRPVEDGHLAEVVPVVVDVVDEALERRYAETARHEQDVVPLHLLEGETLAERPSDADDVATLLLGAARRSRRPRCVRTAR